MKTSVVVALFMLAGCSLEAPDYMSEMARVHNTIEYVPNVGEIKLPHETVSSGTGDCVDMTLLLLHNVLMEYGICGAGAATDSHLLAVFHGEYYDPTLNRHTYKLAGIRRIYSYAELMLAALAY